MDIPEGFRPDEVERSRLADLLDDLGPHAPTLLSPWTANDLAAHLVLREHDLVAAPGLVIPGWWSALAQRRQRALALQDFAWLTATIRQGPPPGFFRLPWVRRGPNLNEFFVHHEDLRRANGCAPRAHTQAMNEALWRNVKSGGPYLARRLEDAGLELQWAGTRQTVEIRQGEPKARISGLPGELLLYLFGRREVALVEPTGPEAAVQAVRRGRFGM